jgi:hypothetical protein
MFLYRKHKKIEEHFKNMVKLSSLLVYRFLFDTLKISVFQGRLPGLCYI